MTVARRKSMTQVGFLDWAQAQQGRCGFVGLQPVAMTEGSGNHARTVGNILLPASRLDEDSRYEVLASDADLTTIADAVQLDHWLSEDKSCTGI